MKKSLLAKALTVLGVVGLSLFGNLQTAQAVEDKNNIVYVYNWTEYIPTSLLQEFTAKTGIEVRYTTYESNEEMYSKLKLLGGEGYDVIFPSSYYIKLLKSDGLLQPIDKSKINLKNIIPSLLEKSKLYDPDNKYSIPYTYGFTVLAVNSEEVDPKKITSWADLWKPEYKELVMLNDMLDNFSVALFAKGVQPNNATEKEIEQAAKDLAQLNSKVKQYNSDSPEVPYIERVAPLGMIWTGSAFRAKHEEMNSLEVVYPKEGSILWIDTFAIPAKSKNVEAAYKFINFILDPKNSVKIVKEMGFQTASKVKDLLPKDYAESKILFPPEEVFEKAIINNVPNEKLDFYSKLWTKLRVQ